MKVLPRRRKGAKKDTLPITVLTSPACGALSLAAARRRRRQHTAAGVLAVRGGTPAAHGLMPLALAQASTWSSAPTTSRLTNSCTLDSRGSARERARAVQASAWFPRASIGPRPHSHAGGWQLAQG